MYIESGFTYKSVSVVNEYAIRSKWIEKYKKKIITNHH